MAIIMSHKDWMKLTKGNFTKPRSTQLKAIDSALEKYHRTKSSADQELALKAVINWQQSKGNAWKKSIRNKGNTVENLFRQLNGMGGKADELALAHIRKESEEIFIKLFEKKQLSYRATAGNLIFGCGSNKVLGCKIPGYSANANTIKTVSTTVSTASKAMTLAKAIISNSSEGADKSMVLKLLLQILPNAMKDLAASCAPFVGVAVTGGQVLVKAVDVANKAHSSNRFKMHARRTFSTGDPEAAMKAVATMLDRELKNAEIDLAKGLTELTAKLSTVLLDGGTVGNAIIGVTSTIVKIIMLVRLIVIDIQEKNAANKLLAEMSAIHYNNDDDSLQMVQKKAFAVKVFEANPLIGAYFVCCVPTSVFVNLMFSSENFNNPGMMDKIERATKRHIKPIKEDAGSLVRKHRMFFPSLQRYPGILKKNEKNLKAMLDNSGKSGLKGLGPGDFDENGAFTG